MPKEEIIEFIRQNRQLSLEALSQKTGLKKHKVKKIIERLQAGGQTQVVVANLPGSGRRFIWIYPVLLSLVTFLFYLPILRNFFIFTDDPATIFSNPHIRSINLASFQWMWTTFSTANWIPLTWFSFALDYKLGGLDPRIYHFTNLLLHVANTVLVYFLCLKIMRLAEENESGEAETRSSPSTLPAAFFAALLFGLHPIHVESVAWASERKDVLCAFFYLAGLLLYLNDAAARERKTWKMGLCLGLFIMALLSKSMAVTLPLALLLLDVWPLRRLHSGLSRLLIEKIPFFIASLSVGVVTIVAQTREGAMTQVQGLSPAFHVMNAFHSLVFYLWKMILPFGLSPFYPIVDPRNNVFSFRNLASVLLVILFSLACFFYRKKMPYLAASWLYYVITLLPVLGLLQVGHQAAADRYTYLPSVSLFLLFSAAVANLLSRKTVLIYLFGAALALPLGYLTVGQLAVWKNDVSVWETVARNYPDVSQMVHQNLGEAYANALRPDDALREFNRGLAIPTPNAQLNYGKGRVLSYMGRADEAIWEFKTAIALSPGTKNAVVHKSLWFAYEQKGMHDEAFAEIQEAIRLDPNYAEAYRCLGFSYNVRKQYKNSIEALKTALSLDPSNSEYLSNLGAVYQLAGQADEAIALFKKGIGMNPSEPAFYFGLGKACVEKGNYREAIEALQTALNFQPQNREIYNALGLAYEKSGQKELSAQYYEKAGSR